MGGYYNPTPHNNMMPANPGYFNGPGGSGGAGSNQYYNNVPVMFNPYSGTPGGGGGGSTPQSQSSWTNPYTTQGPQSLGTPGHSSDLGGGLKAVGLQYPGMSNDFAQWLTSQIGSGLSPFGGSTGLPTGGMTQPGQLTAGMNPLLAQLAQFFQTGQSGGIPGLDTLGTIASQGVSALPEWQSMIAAQQQNIGQNQAMMKEQFAGMGNLAGSPFGTAESNYMQQTSLDQNALLAQLQQSNIQNIQMPAINEMFQGSQAMAGGLQALDQSAIDRMYQQFQTDQPQNNPLLPFIQGMSTMYPPTQKTSTAWENINSTIGALGGSGFSMGGGSGGGETAIAF